MRYLFIVSIFIIAISSVFAQPENATVIRLTIDPAAEPTPALRYRLLPELRDKTSGNAATLYYRAMAPEWAPAMKLEKNKAMQKLLDEWTDSPRKAPPEALNWVLTEMSLKEIDRGARRVYCDWQLLERMREEGLGLLIPDVQAMRLYGQLLALRARFEMEKGDFDGAIHSMQTCFAMSRHIADGPTLIHGLVGIAVSSVMIEQMEEMISTPGCPNLYWALTNVPKPFMNLRSAFEGERITMDWLLPGVRDTLQKRQALPRHQALAMARKFADGLEGLVGVTKEGGPKRGQIDYRSRAGMAMMAVVAYPDARRALLKLGWKAKVIEQMPVVEVCLLYEVYNFDRFFDHFSKLHGLPFPQAQAKMEEEEFRFRGETSRTLIPYGMMLARLLLPAVQKVHAATIRPERRIAALRSVEAIRLYAAKHGKLPAKLGDIEDVPIPMDPATGKGFLYERKGTSCVLRTHVNAYGVPPSNVLRYELALRKSKRK